MSLLRIVSEPPALQPNTVFTVGSFPVTSASLAIMLIVVLVVAYVIALNRRLRDDRPGTLQIVSESLYEGMVALVTQLTGNELISRKIFPIIGSLFIFIGLSNIISVVPGFGGLLWHGDPLFRTPTSDFNTTFALALSMILLIQVQSMRDWGFLGYLGRFVQFKELIAGFRQGIGEGFLSLIHFFIGLLDVVSELAKIISLSVRLFGNLFASEMMTVLVMAAFAYGLPALWMSVSMFTGIVQAIVFGALVSVYYTLAMKPAE